MITDVIVSVLECNFTVDIVSALECNLAEIQCKSDVEMSSISAKDKVSFR